ncbi:MAG: hypothetical protein NC818_03400 [Candidatus Omnitrophica bacterium]|nr:hypothetical protein [Candidatus Omnitrophota bacterium]
MRYSGICRLFLVSVLLFAVVLGCSEIASIDGNADFLRRAKDPDLRDEDALFAGLTGPIAGRRVALDKIIEKIISSTGPTQQDLVSRLAEQLDNDDLSDDIRGEIIFRVRDIMPALSDESAKRTLALKVADQLNNNNPSIRVLAIDAIAWRIILHLNDEILKLDLTLKLVTRFNDDNRVVREKAVGDISIIIYNNIYHEYLNASSLYKVSAAMEVEIQRMRSDSERDRELLEEIQRMIDYILYYY